MADITLPDGSIYSSSQLLYAEDVADQELTTPMIGIVLAVNPSDDIDNLSASVKEDQNGWRHECQVLVIDANAEPNLVLENVVVPPSAHSGVDNFSEDLPRGVVRSLDGTKLSEHFKNQDITRLDAEWCVVQFVGGSIDKPYIANWWHHPLNFHDPATTGQALDGKSLKQVDVEKNKYRVFRRINGIQFLVSPEGDFYMDTAEANSKVDVLPSVKRMGKKPGGSVQIDIKNTQQLEFNWNTPVEGLKAGSPFLLPPFQRREESKPHLKAPKKPVGNPEERETKRSYTRWKEFEALLKSSGFTVFCENTSAPPTNGQSGDFLLQAESSIMLAQQPTGGTTATLSINNGKIQLVGSDGTQVNILSDEVQIVTKSGGLVSLKGLAAIVGAKLDVAGPLAVGGVGEPVLLGTFLTDLATYLDEEAKLAGVMVSQFQALESAATGPLAPLAAAFGLIKTAWQDFNTNGITPLNTAVKLPPATNTFTAKNTTSS